ncbi:MAG: DMT family transporter [Crenarchaeota archaeon]|nr:DMT family transporter [Thermoproteota archaeon]
MPLIKEGVLHAVLFALATLSIGSSAILVRLAGAPGPVCALWRLVLSLPIVLLAARPGAPDALSVLSGLALGAHFSLWMDSLTKLPVFISTAVVTTYPALLALVEFAEGRAKPQALLGSAVATASTFLLFGVGDGLDSAGLLEAFAASLAAAVYFRVGREVRRRRGTGEYAFWAYSSAALAVAAYDLYSGLNPLPYLQSSFVWFLLLAAVPQLGGHTVMNYLVKYYHSHVVSSIAFLEPVIAGLLAFLLFGEVPPASSLGPSLGILAGVSMIVLSERKQQIRTPS